MYHNKNGVEHPVKDQHLNLLAAGFVLAAIEGKPCAATVSESGIHTMPSGEEFIIAVVGSGQVIVPVYWQPEDFYVASCEIPDSRIVARAHDALKSNTITSEVIDEGDDSLESSEWPNRFELTFSQERGFKVHIHAYHAANLTREYLFGTAKEAAEMYARLWDEVRACANAEAAYNHAVQRLDTQVRSNSAVMKEVMNHG